MSRKGYEDPEHPHVEEPAADRPPEEIMSALADCIASAPSHKQGALSKAIEDYATSNKRTWASLIGPRHKASFFGRLLWTLNEATDPWRTGD